MIGSHVKVVANQSALFQKRGCYYSALKTKGMIMPNEICTKSRRHLCLLLLSST